MVYTYTPTYYTSLHDSIASICKTFLPFSTKKRRFPAIVAAEQRLSKQQSDNLKWQQDSFHQMLNLIGLCKEGIVQENKVAAFRTHLLETLIASPADLEPTVVLRDKLIFLQELLYAKCISEEEYHASKRPLLQRLAVQGAEIDARDVIVGAKKGTSSEEWSVIDLKDDDCSNNHNMKTVKNCSKESSAVKRMREVVSVFGLVSSSDKRENLKKNDVNNASGNGCMNGKEAGSKPSILMEEILPPACATADKAKKKKNDSRVKLGKRAWAFDGFKKWKRSDSSEDEEAARFSSHDEKPDGVSYAGKLVENPVGEGPDTRQIKRKLHPNGAPTDFFVDKVLAGNIRKQLSQIKEKNQDIHLTDDQIEDISTRLPVDKADLEKFFPKLWCDQYSDIVLDVVRKEFKNHMREMGNQKGEKHRAFDDENSNPNRAKGTNFSSSHNRRSSINRSSIEKGLKYNPFFEM